MSVTRIDSNNSPAILRDAPATDTTRQASPGIESSAAADAGAQAAGSPAASVEISDAARQRVHHTPEEWAAIRSQRQQDHAAHVADLKAATAQKHAAWEAADAVQDAAEAARKQQWADLRAQRQAARQHQQ